MPIWRGWWWGVYGFIQLHFLTSEDETIWRSVGPRGGMEHD